ncbi:MAG: hypothetical protein Q9225_000150 [Loekoesia sp. 1 TL-2023]
MSSCAHNDDNLSQSSTGRDLHHSFSAGYGDGSIQNGTFITDTMEIAGAKLDDFRLGLSKQAINYVHASGILGLSYDLAEADAHYGHTRPYPNLIDRFQAEGYIETRAYSIWLDSVNSSNGSILFGAVDHTRYKGSLKTVPIVQSPDTTELMRTAIQMTSLTLNKRSGNSSILPRDTVAWAALDTGATFSFLPRSMVDPIYAVAGVLFDESTQGWPLISCNLSTADANFTFGFGGVDGPQISVPIGELVSPWTNNITFQDGTPACAFGIIVGDFPYVLLGDTFLRSAYAIFDLENNQIALAQSHNDLANPLNKTITPITKGKDGIPGVVSRLPAIPWPQSYIQSYNAHDASATAATASGIPTLTSSTSASPIANVRVSELPPTASITAEGATGPTPTSNSSTPGPNGGLPQSTIVPGDTNAGVMDVRISVGVLCFGFTMAAAAMVLEIFAP